MLNNSDGLLHFQCDQALDISVEVIMSAAAVRLAPPARTQRYSAHRPENRLSLTGHIKRSPMIYDLKRWYRGR